MKEMRDVCHALFSLCVLGRELLTGFQGVVFLPSLVMKELRGVCPVLSSLCLLGQELQTGFRV